MIFNTGESTEDLKQKYNPEGSNLRMAQLRMLDMLLYIRDICDENNIQWMLFYGNVLGALRHKGFIPWDDDIDIALDRENYIKLCHILKSKKHLQFVLQDNETDSGCYIYYSVLRDLKSEYIQDYPEHKIKKYRGLQVDIFCLQEGVIDCLYKFMGMFAYHNIYDFAGRGKKDYLAKFFYKLGKYVLIPSCDMLSSFFGKKEFYSIQYGFHDITYSRWHRDILFPPKDYEFEGYKFPLPAQPEKYCSIMYGDYMKLPDINDREGHKAKYVIYN